MIFDPLRLRLIRLGLSGSDPKYAHQRRKHTSSKITRATEGWVEFTDKHVARSVADLLNGHAVGGKRGERYKDDVWTMKYLPKFKWNMLTEQLRKSSSHFFRGECYLFCNRLGFDRIRAVPSTERPSAPNSVTDAISIMF